MPRPSDDPRYHTARWRQTRARVLRSQGPHCSRSGCTSDMTKRGETHVDHIIDVPRSAPDSEFYDETNLQVLCKRHHYAKSLDVAASSAEPQSPNA
jgi:5-methylcytosine-specific restriction endonuclease McrA